MIILNRPDLGIVQATVNQAQAASTYDLLTATGDVMIIYMALYCTVVGATWTSTTVQTNDTTPFVFVDATQGARANFTAGKNITLTWSPTIGVQKPFLRSGQKIQYTIAGSTGTGTSLAVFHYMQATSGAILS